MERVKQEAQDALKVRSEFVANVTHELRTPVNGILGNVKELAVRFFCWLPNGYSVEKPCSDCLNSFGKTHDIACKMIEDGECGQFSPDILECFRLAKADFFDIVEVVKMFSFV